MSVESLTPRVREALGVSQTYDTETIPNAIRRAIQRLLRDYNFPKTIKQFRYAYNAADYPPDWPVEQMGVDQSLFPLPKGFKKELDLKWIITDTAFKPTSWSDSLKKLEGFAPRLMVAYRANTIG